MTIRDNPTSHNNEISLSRDKELISKFGLTKEEILLKDLKLIAKEFFEVEKLKKSLVYIILKNLKELNFSEFIEYPRYYIKEKYVKKSLTSANLRGLNVVSVDGSAATKRYMNVDFSFLKAIAVKYSFKENHKANIEYFPDLSGFNNYFVQGNFFNRDESTIDTNVSMDMTFIEINLLNEMIKKADDIDMIIIDGSIVIMPINLLFSKDPEISKKYDRLLKEYHKLYLNCKENGIILVGSIKDTRTSALANLLCESIQLLKPSYSKLSDFIKLGYREIMNYFSERISQKVNIIAANGRENMSWLGASILHSKNELQEGWISNPEYKG